MVLSWPPFPVLDELGISVLLCVVAAPVRPLSRVGAPTRTARHSFVGIKFRTSRVRRADLRSPTVLHAREGPHRRSRRSDRHHRGTGAAASRCRNRPSNTGHQHTGPSRDHRRPSHPTRMRRVRRIQSAARYARLSRPSPGADSRSGDTVGTHIGKGIASGIGDGTPSPAPELSRRT